MLVKQPISEQLIIDYLYLHYGIQISSLTFLPLGADSNASVYKAEAQDKSTYFLKLKRGNHDDMGMTILQLLQKTGIQEIILPIKTKNGRLTQSLDDYTLILYPFVEGLDGFTRALTDEQWLILGKTLRKIHEIDVPISVKQWIRKENYSPKWRDIVRSLYIDLENLPASDHIAQKLSAFMKKNSVTIKRLVDRAEQLAQIIQNGTQQFVLCHADLHGGNVLINSNHIYIVDWDNPMMAPKERDLMFIGGGVANVWNKPHEEVLFYKGYGEVEINRAILAYYRHERIIEDIAIYGQDLLLKATGGENRSEMYRHFMAMFEPRGVVDIAFKTDEKNTLSDSEV